MHQLGIKCILDTNVAFVWISFQVVLHDPATDKQSYRSTDHAEKVGRHEANIFPEPPPDPSSDGNAQDNQYFFHDNISLVLYHYPEGFNGQ